MTQATQANRAWSAVRASGPGAGPGESQSLSLSLSGSRSLRLAVRSLQPEA